MRLSYCDTDTSSTAMSISGSVPIASAASNAFSMNSRSVVYSDFPAFSNPAMPLLSWKNSAGDFCVRFLSPFAFRFVGFFGGIVRKRVVFPSVAPRWRSRPRPRRSGARRSSGSSCRRRPFKPTKFITSGAHIKSHDSSMYNDALVEMYIYIFNTTNANQIVSRAR